MKKFLTLLTLAYAICSLSPVTAQAGESIYMTDEDQPLYGKLVFSTEPLTTMTEIPFRVEFGDDPSNKPSLHSAVCSLTMPAMAMPDNHPDLACSESSCTGKAIFTMAGAWQATFGLIMKDGAHTSITFNIDMVKMK